LGAKAAYPETVWRGVLQALPRFESADAISVFETLTLAPDELLRKIARELDFG